MDGRANRRKKDAFSNLSGLVWTGPKMAFSVTENGLQAGEIENGEIEEIGEIENGRKRSFSKTLTSNGHVISVTVPFRPLIQNDGRIFMLTLIPLLSSLIACLELNVAMYNLYAILRRRRQNTSSVFD